MSNNYFTRAVNRPQFVHRSNKPRYRCESVLSTEVFPFVRAREYEKTLDLIAAAHPDSWYIRYHFFSDNAEEAVRRVPSVTMQFNRSRVLRRAQISGARMCCLSHHNVLYYYVTDMVVSCSYDALVFASLLNTFKKFDEKIIVEFKYLFVEGRNKKRIMARRLDELIEKFYRRSKLPRNAVRFSRLDDDVDGDIRCELTTTKPIFDIIRILCDVLNDDIVAIKFGKHTMFEMSRVSTIDLDSYTFRPIDGIVEKFNYRKFSSFGCYANGQNIVKLKHSAL